MCQAVPFGYPRMSKTRPRVSFTFSKAAGTSEIWSRVRSIYPMLPGRRRTTSPSSGGVQGCYSRTIRTSRTLPSTPWSERTAGEKAIAGPLQQLRLGGAGVVLARLFDPRLRGLTVHRKDGVSDLDARFPHGFVIKTCDHGGPFDPTDFQREHDLAEILGSRGVSVDR